MISRRGFFAGTAVAAVSATAASITTANVVGSNLAEELGKKAETAVLNRKAQFYGLHQNGIELALQSFTTFIALDLKPTTDKLAMKRWMSLLTDDIAKIMSGEEVVADPHPEIAPGSARATVTLGFGPGLFEKLNLQDQRPKTFAALPSFKIDKLQEEFSDGDVLLHVSADDPILLSHSVRALIRDSVSFADVRWTQSGFTNAQGVSPEGTRQRNLMGQVDGTDNPDLNTEDFDNLVWIKDGPKWAVGGTLLVLRRISMTLNTWDKMSRPQKEDVIGRKLSNGAPLTGKLETDIPDLEATKPNGLKVISSSAHIRRAGATNLKERFFRRPFNYDVGTDVDGTPNVGLLWTAYMADLDQYIPVQKRLADFDLLNMWTTPIGSSVWAIPTGVQPGEKLAEELFS
ncbi:MAG: Dyp-type peroxidase [Micrococcales bacterium]